MRSTPSPVIMEAGYPPHQRTHLLVAWSPHPQLLTTTLGRRIGSAAEEAYPKVEDSPGSSAAQVLEALTRVRDAMRADMGTDAVD